MVFSPDKLPGIMDAWTNLWKQGRNDIFCTVAIAALNPDNKVPPTVHHPTVPNSPSKKKPLHTLYYLRQGFLVFSGSASKALSAAGTHISSLEGEICRINSCDYKDRLFATPPQTSGPRGTTYQPPFAMPEYWADVRLVSCLRTT